MHPAEIAQARRDAPPAAVDGVVARAPASRRRPAGWTRPRRRRTWGCESFLFTFAGDGVDADDADETAAAAMAAPPPERPLQL